MKAGLFYIAIIVCFGCNTNNKTIPAQPVDSADTAGLSPVNQTNDSSLSGLSHQILEYLKEKNFKALANYAHPDGILFSPYGFIDTASAQVLQPKDIISVSSKSKAEKLHWGFYDGSGDSILLSFHEYFSKFVYDADFVSAEKFSVDKRLGTGNALHNIEAVFPGSHFTEAHFSGFEAKYDGMDWKSLRLVFMRVNGSNKLVAIVHDQWTI